MLLQEFQEIKFLTFEQEQGWLCVAEQWARESRIKVSIEELMKKCEFAQEMKDHILPNKKEVIGHYFYVQNLLMVTQKEHLKKRPPFYIC